LLSPDQAELGMPRLEVFIWSPKLGLNGAASGGGVWATAPDRMISVVAADTSNTASRYLNIQASPGLSSGEYAGAQNTKPDIECRYLQLLNYTRKHAKAGGRPHNSHLGSGADSGV
jgi:hypothetical protein